MWAKDITQIVGNTPLIELGYIKEAIVVAKCEFMNPTGSIKDRIAVNMIKEALKRGDIDKNSTIIEPTSGNTGIGLASVCASLGLELIIVMPESMSKERRDLMEFYGAKLILTPAENGMKGAIEVTKEYLNSHPNCYQMDQFNNPDNPLTHYRYTAKEIYTQMEGDIDLFVASVGTGGTLSGVGRYLKEKNPNIKIVAVEPENSPYISKGIAGSHKIQGIGAGFIPNTLDKSIIDYIITVSDESAIDRAKECAMSAGLAVGISSGANIEAICKLLKDPLYHNKKIVTVLSDNALRYMSTELFE